MKQFLNNLREILKYPSAIFGIFIVVTLVISAIIVVVKIPYNDAIDIWRGGEQVVGKNPRTVPPKWYNWFREDKLVVSFDMVEGDEGVTVTEETTEGGTLIKTTTFTFDHQYESFPTELTMYFTAEYKEKQPFVSLKWITPDGTEIKINNFAIGKTQTYPINQEEKLLKKLGNVAPVIGLFLDQESESEVQTPVKGTYQLVVEQIVFEPDSTVQPEFVLLGEVFGWAGTDHMRRDLIIADPVGYSDCSGFWFDCSLGNFNFNNVYCCYWYLVWWHCGWHYSENHRDKSGAAVPINSDHDWYFLFQKSLDDFRCHSGVEYFYRWN